MIGAALTRGGRRRIFQTASAVLFGLVWASAIAGYAWFKHEFRIQTDGWGGLALFALLIYSMMGAGLLALVGLVLGLVGLRREGRSRLGVMATSGNGLFLLVEVLCFLMYLPHEESREQAQERARAEYLANRTPEQHLLDVASDVGADRTIESLVKGGVPVDVKDDQGRTPLIRAIDSIPNLGSVLHPNVRMLLALGASTEIKDPRGWTALHHACYSEDPKIVELLIEKGADVRASTKEGETPLEILSMDKSGYSEPREKISAILKEALKRGDPAAPGRPR